MATHSYVQVPPDGAGKKVHTIQHVEGSDIVETQIIHVSDHDDPTHILAIDPKGAAKVTFAEGAPSLDAFGNLRTSSSVMLQSYMHMQSNLNELFTTQTTGGLEGGSIYYDTDNSAISLRNTTAVGSVLRATNHYHHYQAGTGMLIIITGRLSDTGLTNNIRRWGYYDKGLDVAPNGNGLFWELNGTTFGVGIRKSDEDTVIPRSQWNGDKLDGSGISGMVLDLTKANFYWIDFAWLGVGCVRFGVLSPEGSRVVCHTFQNPNANTGPYMNVPNLPLCFENINNGVTTTAPTLEFICGAVYAESDVQWSYKKRSDLEVENVVVGSDTLVMALRANVYYPNQDDYTQDTTQFFLEEAYLKSINFYTTAPIYLELFKDCTTSGVVWDLYGSAALRGGRGGELTHEGIEFAAWCLGSGFHNIELDSYFEFNKLGIHINFDNTQPEWGIVASNLTDAVATVKLMSVTYKEVQ